MARLTEGLRQLAAGETEAAEGGPVDELVHAQDAVAKAKVRPQSLRRGLFRRVGGGSERGWLVEGYKLPSSYVSTWVVVGSMSQPT